ncbi:MAG: hypothetical protein Q9203_004897 [Teloschistes exilis]
MSIGPPPAKEGQKHKKKSKAEDVVDAELSEEDDCVAASQSVAKRKGGPSAPQGCSKQRSRKIAEKAYKQTPLKLLLHTQGCQRFNGGVALFYLAAGDKGGAASYLDTTGFTLGPKAITMNYVPADEYVLDQKIRFAKERPKAFVYNSRMRPSSPQALTAIEQHKKQSVRFELKRKTRQGSDEEDAEFDAKKTKTTPGPRQKVPDLDTIRKSKNSKGQANYSPYR